MPRLFKKSNSFLLNLPIYDKNSLVKILKSSLENIISLDFKFNSEIGISTILVLFKNLFFDFLKVFSIFVSLNGFKSLFMKLATNSVDRLLYKINPNSFFDNFIIICIFV